MLLSLCLLFIVPCLNEGCTVVKTQLHIPGYVGDSVLLPCSCTDPNTRPESFTWHKIQGSSITVISSENEWYRNRVQLGTTHSPGNLSLLISHLTEEDEGLYRCYIDGSNYTDMKLAVEDRQRVILGHVGGSVLLRCSWSEPGAPKWTFKDKEIYPTDQTQRYTGRLQLSDSPGNLSLLISHLNKKDEGVYACSISSKTIRKATLEITVAPVTKVQTGAESSTTASHQTPTGTNKSETQSEDSPSSPNLNLPSMYFFIPIPVLLLLLGIGVIYWRYRVQRRGHREPRIQDDEMYYSVIHSTTTRTAIVEDTADKTDKTIYTTIKLIHN